jgi:hypothetical protein
MRHKFVEIDWVLWEFGDVQPVAKAQAKTTQ